MSDISDEFACPICFEIPIGEIHQCNNGHWLCQCCSRSLSNCPQCRGKFGKERIRNRVLEDILDKRVYNCPNKPSGCHIQMYRKELSSHLSVCSHRVIAIEICKLLGYDCSFKAESSHLASLVDHYRNVHGSVVQDDRNVSVVLEGFEECQLNKTACWTPAFIVEKRNEKQNTFMVFVRSNGVDQTLSCFCVLLSNSKEMADNFGVKYSISGGSEEVSTLRWSTSVVNIMDAETFLWSPSLLVPMNLLLASYKQNGVVKLLCEIQDIPVADKVDTGNSEKVQQIHVVLESKEKPGFTARPIPPGYTMVFSTYTCDGCKATPIRGILYHCTQCASFDLCMTCRQKGLHSHHLFIEIRSATELIVLEQLYISKMLGTWKPLLSKDTVAEETLTCTECLQESKTMYYCHNCTPLYVICIDCFRMERRRAKCEKHLIRRVALERNS